MNATVHASLAFATHLAGDRQQAVELYHTALVRLRLRLRLRLDLHLCCNVEYRPQCNAIPTFLHHYLFHCDHAWIRKNNPTVMLCPGTEAKLWVRCRHAEHRTDGTRRTRVRR